jgi:hypothetical protein
MARRIDTLDCTEFGSTPARSSRANGSIGMISCPLIQSLEDYTPYRKISVNIARTTVEIIRASELRKRRNTGGFWESDRMMPIECFISSI